MSPKRNAPDVEGDARRALQCLPLEVPESVHRDVSAKIEAWVAAIRSERDAAVRERDEAREGGGATSNDPGGDGKLVPSDRMEQAYDPSGPGGPAQRLGGDLVPADPDAVDLALARKWLETEEAIHLWPTSLAAEFSRVRRETLLACRDLADALVRVESDVPSCWCGFSWIGADGHLEHSPDCDFARAALAKFRAAAVSGAGSGGAHMQPRPVVGSESDDAHKTHDSPLPSALPETPETP